MPRRARPTCWSSCSASDKPSDDPLLAVGLQLQVANSRWNGRVTRSRFPLPGDPLTAGIDEAGRGPLAGPLVVAAVILDPARRINGIADSKQLSEGERDKLYVRIVERAIAWSAIVVSVEHIDRINIFQATLHGMREALLALAPGPELALVDGNRLPPGLPCQARAIVGGDDSEPAIGAASIIAKVTRDRLMCELDARHPHYGFARHKGYCTPEHFEALRRHGPCASHRRSFAPVRAVMQAGLDLAYED